jgi:hypothetical protein
MITFFTTFRTYEAAQKNALASWLAIDPGSDVIVFTESESAALSDLKPDRVKIRPVPSNDPSGPALLDGIFEEASTLSRHRLLCYCNSDIILVPEFMERIKTLVLMKHSFVAVSQRVDVKIDFAVDLSDRLSVEKLQEAIRTNGKLHPPLGSDVFVFPKGQYSRQNMPPLVVGRGGWDLWMVYDARNRFNRLIDLTGPSSAVIHQDHPFAYQAENPAHQVNYQFLPPKEMYTFVLSYCNYRWTKNGIVPMAVKSKDRKRIRWEMRFAKRGPSYWRWWTLWKFEVAKQKIKSLL